MRHISNILRCFVFSMAVVLLTIPQSVFAEFSNPLRPGLDSIAGFTSAALKAATYILFPVAVVFMVYSGFLFITAQGNSEKLSKAKMNFFWTVVGIALLLGAWALSELIRGTIEPLLG